jgi:deazaflavin-dependent oxidoreductase (nitroreductase family)
MKYANAAVSFLLRLGLPMGPQALLTVTGRRSGLPRTTPVALNRREGGWLLVSVYGTVDWVRNLRAAKAGVVTMRRRSVPVMSQELSAGEAAPIIRDLLEGVNPIVRAVIGRNFAADPGADLSEWAEEARSHPVFLLTPVDFAWDAEFVHRKGESQ